LQDLSKVLDTYTLLEIFEENDLTEEEVLEFLLDEGFLRLPETLPADYYL
jgi:hypothetical protein